MAERLISNLHQHSAYSFNDGVCTPEEIVTAAKAKGLKSIAITDHGHCHAHARFFLEGKKQGVRTILGTEAYVINDFQEWHGMKEKLALEKKQETDDVEFDLEKAVRDKANRKVLYRKGHLVMVAQNRIGLANIYRLTFKAHKYGYFSKPRMDKKMLAEHAEGIVASSACMGGVISSKISAMMRGEIEWDELRREVEEFKEIFSGRFFLELQSNEAAFQKDVNLALVKLHNETNVPLIVTMDAHYVNPDDWQAQQVLHLLLTHRSKTGGLTLGNLPPDYRFDVRSLYVKSADELWDSFVKNNPEVTSDVLQEAFDNTLVADGLIDNFEPDTSQRLPSLPYEDTFKELCNSSVAGLKAKGFEDNDVYMERLAYELGIIRDKGLANYFLVVRNICDAARKEMIIGPGRGCFLPETRVCMDNGMLVPMAMIITGDTVIDAFGKQQNVLDTFSYEIDEDIVCLEFENGIKIKCTKDHKFLTLNRGWIAAIDLTELDELAEVRPGHIYNDGRENWREATKTT